MGGTWEIRAFAEAAINLQAGRPTDHPELCCFASWADVEAYANTKDGEDLRVLVSLTREDPAGLVAALGRFENDPDQADVTCSTAHKAKGAEWNRVRLLDDFPIGIEPGAEELRLLYVAVTRPREILDVEDALLYGIEDR